ncbi:MAG: patatin-like protein [Sphingobium sp.]|jgi:patatin-related protein|nr:patatin-like protein [Sphingobium sp.]MCI1271892.1 patatin-like protein [Sphingobium sp.]MCI1754811.1 patatin-like protein [Sphingobium sp.]MCI2053014.1 patatin-like protein [Sphingobium sp.]
MREKELRLALVCYGGISLAVYMHGITKEIWNFARASRDFHEGKDSTRNGVLAVYRDLLRTIDTDAGLRVRIIIDIVAGASAGGINGIFLAQAIETGQSLEPLTEMWLDNADVEKLLDPDARPAARFTKFWAQPIVWLAARRRGDAVERTVSPETREEVRHKLSSFVRSRWFQPPFGGKTFTRLLLDAFDSMASTHRERPLLPYSYPLDLIVTVTDFEGYPEMLRLNSPPEVREMEHRLTIPFRTKFRQGNLADSAELVFAARATASFPGAFPPFTVRELDKVLARMNRHWPGRARFLARVLPKRNALGQAEGAVLIDGSVLSNAPFAPAIMALKDRPARREIDRRFVYIDPKPTSGRAFAFNRNKAAKPGEDQDEAPPPGFFRTIFGSLSDIPREQPIRDNLEAIEARSRTIYRMRRITESLREEIEREIEDTFGGTWFLNQPTPARLASWRSKAQTRAAVNSGFAYPAYALVKLSSIIEEVVAMLFRLGGDGSPATREKFRQAIWAHVREQGLDQMREERKGGARPEIIAFFRDHDLGFRIRRLRFMARRLTETADTTGPELQTAIGVMRNAIYSALAIYQESEASDSYSEVMILSAEATAIDPEHALAELAEARNLKAKDLAVEEMLAGALATLPKAERRAMLLAYLGFPFYDIATLPLLQGEGLDEFDPIKVDRISPDDCTSLRSGGAAAMLKGIEFNNFGAFFSRAYRENDYLWGRLHGAERMIDILLSTVKEGDLPNIKELARATKFRAFAAILAEEEPHLKHVADLVAELKERTGESR